MTIEEKFEQSLARIHKAIEWLDDPKRTMEEVDKWMPKYEELFEQTMELGRRLARNDLERL